MTSATFSQPAVRLLWWVIFVFLFLNTAFLGFLAQAYLHFFSKTSLMRTIARDFLFSQQFGFLEQYHAVIGTAYLVVAAPFAVVGLRMVCYSLHQRRLAFGSVTRTAANDGQNNVNTKGNAGFASNLRLSFITRLRRGFTGVSIGGDRFVELIAFFETVEITLQTIQGFDASKSISDPFFSQIYGTMILVNCCSTPLILYCCERMKQSAKVSHVLCALTNSLLAFTWGTVIQGLLLFRYWRYEVDEEWTDLVPETYERELDHMLVLSPTNFVFSTFTFVSSGITIVRCTRALASDQRNADVKRTTEHQEPPRQNQVAPVRIAWTRWPQRTNTVASLRGGLFWWYGILILFGICILIASMGATGKIWSLHDSVVPCLDQLYPWFVSDVACVGRLVNCTQFRVSGKKGELDDVLYSFNTYLLANLAIVDCAALEMPSSVQDFRQLETLTVMNAVVIQWDTTAAIDDLHFPMLKTLTLHSVEFVSIPTGIVSQPLPASFEWMNAADINAETFIDMVGDNWSMVIYFYCQSCNWRSIPAMVHNMSKLQTVEFQNNQVSSIGKHLFEDKPLLTFIGLDGNPLTELPESVWLLLCQSWWLNVRNTSLSVIPPSALTAAAKNKLRPLVSAAGSPLCPTKESFVLDQIDVDCSSIE